MGEGSGGRERWMNGERESAENDGWIEGEGRRERKRKRGELGCKLNS